MALSALFVSPVFAITVAPVELQVHGNPDELTVSSPRFHFLTGKALELAVTFLVQPPPEEELFCTRQQRVAQERVEQVIFLLKQNLANPPGLEELGKKIGCSHFYLSRIFSAQTGQTITQYLRQ